MGELRTDIGNGFGLCQVRGRICAGVPNQLNSNVP